MGTILALGPVVLFVVMFVAFRNRGVLRDDHGNTETPRNEFSAPPIRRSLTLVFGSRRYG